MRTWMPISGLMLLALTLGCVSDPISTGVTMEQVVIDLPCPEPLPDDAGAKRIAICRFKDVRRQTTFLGKNIRDGGNEVTKYIIRQDIEEVVAKTLAGNFKHVGMNVTYVPTYPVDVRGDTIRAIVKEQNADFVVVGKIMELSLTVLDDSNSTALVTMQYQFSLYNNNGQLKANHRTPVSVAKALGDQMKNPQAVSAVVAQAVDELCAMAFSESFFVKSLGLNPDEVNKMMESRSAPVLPEPAPEPTPAELAPAEPAPADTTEPAEPADGTMDQ